jgi:ribose transport system substrate-binding protein
MNKMKVFFVSLVALSLILGACQPAAAPAADPAKTEAPGASAPAATAAPAEEKGHDIVLINNFMGNTWRPMMERSAQILAEKGPLAERVASFRIMNTENSATAQNAAINSLVLEGKTDLILLVAASPTASNQAIKAACDAGIVIVSYDVLVEEPCAWKINQDWKKAGRGWAKWIANQMGGKGVIFHDLGQSGASSSRDIVAGNEEVLKNYPDLKIYTYYGEFAQGTEQAGVATLLAAHPEVNGILSHGYGANALYALDKAGLKPLPVTGFGYNESLLACLNYKVPCLLKGQGAWVSGEAMKLGLDILDGKVTGEPRFIEVHMPWFTNTDDTSFAEEGDPVYKIQDYAEANLPGGLMMPLSPPWFEFDSTEVLTPPKVD